MHARLSKAAGTGARDFDHPRAHGEVGSPPPPRIPSQLGTAARSSGLPEAMPAHAAAAPAPDAVPEAEQGADEDIPVCIFCYGPQAHAEPLVRPCACSTLVHPRCWAKWLIRPNGNPPDVIRGTDTWPSYRARQDAADAAHEQVRTRCIACKVPIDNDLMQAATLAASMDMEE